MINPQKVLVPGILLGCLILILLARLLLATEPASAATPQPEPQSTNESAKGTSGCSLPNIPESIQPWCNLIEASAQKYAVPAELIASVMLQESGGQAQVISASGAVGLLQVMPRDGIASGFMCANGPCFASRPSTQDLLDPAFNVDYGTRMLANLIGKYGSEREALKAYGPYDVGYYYADKVLAIKENL
jgi:soluble lytic murein transglycosylase-like protein